MTDDEEDIKINWTDLSSLYKKMTVKDMLIILLVFMLWLMYILHTREIASCNEFYKNIPIEINWSVIT